MSTDTGQSSTTLDASWAHNSPEKLTDWGYRALHGSVVLAKALTRRFHYGSRHPAHMHMYSHYSGCSTGGRQGLIEAERFPADFAGVVDGAPAAVEYEGRDRQSACEHACIISRGSCFWRSRPKSGGSAMARMDWVMVSSRTLPGATSTRKHCCAVQM